MIDDNRSTFIFMINNFIKIQLGEPGEQGSPKGLHYRLIGRIIDLGDMDYCYCVFINCLSNTKTEV